MSNLPSVTPAETIDISPEALEIANTYLQCQDVKETADQLGIGTELVTQFLDRREVKAYINSVFFNVGFNNRFRLREAMDAVIRKKFQELEESEMGSTKDIAELLALSHKMTMEEMNAQIALEKVKESNMKNQVNVQINEGFSDGSKYGKLIQQLIGSATSQSDVIDS